MTSHSKPFKGVPMHLNVDPIKMYKEELQILEAVPGTPQDSQVLVPCFAQDIREALNDIIKFRYSAAHLFDSAAAFFLYDNVGLPEVAQYLKVLAIDQRNKAWSAINFLNKRGGRPELSRVHAFPTERWSKKDSSDALYVFTEALAVAKVGLQLESRGMKWADEHGDADAHRFFSMLSCSEAEQIRSMSKCVTFLKLVGKDPHAIKDFDRAVMMDMESAPPLSVMTATVAPNDVEISASSWAGRSSELVLELLWPSRDPE